MEKNIYVVGMIENLMGSLSEPDYARRAKDALRILEEKFEEKFYRVEQFPDNVEEYYSNFVLMAPGHKVEVYLGGEKVNRTINSWFENP